jgi:hypothetical protein
VSAGALLAAGTPVAFVVMFGVFILLVLALGVFVVRFAIRLNRQRPGATPRAVRPSPRKPPPAD